MAKDQMGALRKACFINPVNGDRVLVSSIAGTTELPLPEKITTETPTGEAFGGNSFNYTVAFFDYSAGGATILDTWEEDDTPVIAVLLHDNGVRFWLDPVPISGYRESSQMNADDGVSPLSVNMQIKYCWPFVYMGVNFLKAVCKRNADNKTQFDVSTNYAPDVRTAGTGQLRLDYLSAGLGAPDTNILTLQFPFPFPGESFNIGMGTTGITDEFTVQARLFNDTVVNAENFVANGSANAFTVGAGAYWLRIIIPAVALQSMYARLRGTGNVTV